MADDGIADQELSNFANVQQQRVMLQEGVMRITNTCFDKCITKPTSSLDSWTEGCLQNCVGRFIDAQKLFLTRLQQKAQMGG